jgi:TatD DNase family protein
MTLTDTHTHLYLPDFDNDREAVLERAFQNDVSKIFLPNIDASTVDPMLRLVEQFPDQIFPMMGLHPTSVKENFREELNHVKSWLDRKIFKGVGEVGIDLYWDSTFKDMQIEAFREQVFYSLEYNLPLIIHIRNSFDEVFNVLNEFRYRSLCGIFHSFTGNIEQARKAIRMGFKIGINGIVTFKNSGLSELVKNIGLDHIVLETDAPYLSPVPKRGKRNESSHLIYIADKIAEIFSTDMEKVAAITSQNAKQVFNS